MASKTACPRRSDTRRTRVARAMSWLLMTAAAVLLQASHAGVKADAAFRGWLEQVWPEARDLGVSRQTFDVAFTGVTPDLTIPDLVIPGKEKAPSKGQAEFTKTPQEYLSKSYLVKLAEQGQGLLQQHAAALADIERRIGVERNVVVAIWGRETAFGMYKLPHYGIRVLATQAYTGRRKEMFRKELLYALKLLQDGILTPETMRTSWAGALGLTQFMPSEFYSYAVDIDGDGRKDIWNSVPDALGSAATQLKAKGWVTGETWGYEVKMPAGVDCSLEGPVNERPIAEWVKLGFERTQGRGFKPEHLRQNAYLLSPAGAFGPAFLVLENFKVLKRYNPADLYALFVGNLADRISGGSDFDRPWGSVTQLGSTDIETIQEQLQARGWPMGKIDGKAGALTRASIGAYQKKHQLAVDCWADAALLRHMKSLASQ